jgi:uncharacterized protein (TIGR03083 family)
MEDRELELHAVAMDEFGLRVGMIREDQWDAPTPCEGWTVRDLVDHLVVEQLWVPALLGGATVAEVGDRFTPRPISRSSRPGRPSRLGS